MSDSRGYDQIEVETSDILNGDGMSPEDKENPNYIQHCTEDPNLYYTWPLNYHVTITVLIITHHTVIS